jgi:hypothetical protein
MRPVPSRRYFNRDHIETWIRSFACSENFQWNLEVFRSRNWFAVFPKKKLHRPKLDLIWAVLVGWLWHGLCFNICAPGTCSMPASRTRRWPMGIDGGRAGTHRGMAERRRGLRRAWGNTAAQRGWLGWLPCGNTDETAVFVLHGTSPETEAASPPGQNTELHKKRAEESGALGSIERQTGMSSGSVSLEMGTKQGFCNALQRCILLGFAHGSITSN